MQNQELLENQFFEVIYDLSEYESQITCYSFNNDSDIIICGTTLGFRIYQINQDSIILLKSREGIHFSMEIGKSNFKVVSQICMLEKTYLIAYSIRNEDFKQNLYIWNEKDENILQQLDFYAPISKIIYLVDYLIVATVKEINHRISIIDLTNYKIIKIINQQDFISWTCNNISQKLFLAYTIQSNYNQDKQIIISNINLNFKLPKLIIAQDIQNIWLNNDVNFIIKFYIDNFNKASKLAVVNKNGTNISVYQVNNQKLLFNFTRGMILNFLHYVKFHFNTFQTVLQKRNDLQ